MKIYSADDVSIFTGEGGGSIAFDHHGVSVYPSIDGEFGRMAAGSNRAGLTTLKQDGHWLALPMLVNLLRLSHSAISADYAEAAGADSISEAQSQLDACRKAHRRWQRFCRLVMPLLCEISDERLVASPRDFLDWWSAFSTDSTIQHGSDFLTAAATLYRGFENFERDKDDALILAAIKISAQESGEPPTKSAVKSILKEAGFRTASWETIRWNEIWQRLGFQWLPSAKSGRKS